MSERCDFVRLMKFHRKIRAAMQAGEIVTVCCECNLHRIGKEWFPFPKQNYARYSHGYCEEHAAKFQEEIDAYCAALN